VCKASRVAVQQAGTVVTVVIVMVVPPRPPYHIFWLTVAVVLEAIAITRNIICGMRRKMSHALARLAAYKTD